MLYRRCFGALSQAVAAQNKHLVIRVFPASNDDLSTVLDAIEPLPPTVSVSIKLTPERFWPAFPNNPALLAVQTRDVWVDIDLAGEEVGWGVMPFLRIDELQGRLLWCQSRNPRITGAICKASWESIDNHWIPDTLSECNLFACSQLLGDGMAKNQQQLLDQWLAQRYGWCPPDDVAQQFRQLLEQGAQTLYQAIYVRDHVFHRHSQLPESYGQAVWSLYGQLARSHWLPGSAQDIHFTRDDPQKSMSNLTQIAQEKDEVASGAQRLGKRRWRLPTRRSFLPRWSGSGVKSGRGWRSIASCLPMRKRPFLRCISPARWRTAGACGRSAISMCRRCTVARLRWKRSASR